MGNIINSEYSWGTFKYREIVTKYIREIFIIENLAYVYCSVVFKYREVMRNIH